MAEKDSYLSRAEMSEFGFIPMQTETNAFINFPPKYPRH